MKERPIIFTGESVKAILDGRKSQTRRVLKEESVDVISIEQEADNRWRPYYSYAADCGRIVHKHQPKSWFHKCSYGVVGDLLWVREPFNISDISQWCRMKGSYSQNNEPFDKTLTADEYNKCCLWKKETLFRTKSSLFMFKSLARIWLEIKNIRVERVQDISHNDWVADFAPTYHEQEKALATFVGNTNKKEMAKDFWDSLNAKRGFGWDKNSWVWVIEFEVKK